MSGITLRVVLADEQPQSPCGRCRFAHTENNGVSYMEVQEFEWLVCSKLQMPVGAGLPEPNFYVGDAAYEMIVTECDLAEPRR